MMVLQTIKNLQQVHILEIRTLNLQNKRIQHPDPKAELTKVLNQGKAIFNDPKLGKSGMSCNSCHPNGGTTGGQMMGMAIPTLKGAAATFPKYKASSQRCNNTSAGE